MKTGSLQQAASAVDTIARHGDSVPAQGAAEPRIGPAGPGWIVAVLDDLVQLSGSVGLADTAQALRQARQQAEAELSRDRAAATPA